jgi:diguanylate cyclase (GGDEF)-like protein
MLLNQAFPLPSVFLMLSSLLCAGLGIRALTHDNSPFARYFAALMLALVMYSMGYALELGAGNEDAMWVALQIQYYGVPFVPALWVLLAYSYLGNHDIPIGGIVLVLTLPLLTFVFAQTNQAHHLYYASVDYTRDGDLTISRLGHGPWYYVHFAYINLSFLIGSALFYRAWRVAQPVYRTQAMLMLLGSVAPWVGYVLYLAGLSPKGVDLTPFGMIVTSMLYAVGTQRYGILDIQPIARSIVFDGIAEGVIVLDTEQRVVDFNATAATVFPLLTAHAVGRPLSVVTREADVHAEALIVEHGTLSLGTSEVPQDFEVKCYPLRSRRGKVVGRAVLLRDITEKSRLERELIRQARIDQLTGVYNRHHLVELSENALQLAQRHGRKLSLIIVDVDHFKQVNDSIGHLAGDSLLGKIAALMQSRIRATDILGRYGGDEFVITLPETPAEAALQIANELCTAAATETSTSLSMGVAEWYPGVRSFRELLHKADEALYRVKAEGRGHALRYEPLADSSFGTAASNLTSAS